MTYLSRLLLNPRSRAVQRDLSDCQQMHRSILRLFPQTDGGGRVENGVLFRVDESDHVPQLLTQSSAKPDWTLLPADYLIGAPACKRIDDVYKGIDTGQELTFRLRANPTKRVFREELRAPNEKDWAGHRVNLAREEDQIAWLRRKGEQGGFVLLAIRTAAESGSESGALHDERGGDGSPPAAVDVRPGGKLYGRRHGLGLTFGSAIFEGELRVVDANRFHDTLVRGIGSGKAYGFGLLSIAPPARFPGVHQS